MVKKPRDSVALYPRRLEVSKVDRGRLKKLIAVLKEPMAVGARAPLAAGRFRTKRTVAARAARRRIVERAAP